MNKFFNALLFVVFVPTMVLSIFAGFDVPIPILRSTGAELTYNKEAFFVFGVFMLIINLRRSTKRWSALKVVNQTSKFKWSTIVTKERVKRVYVYNFSEAFILAIAGIVLFLICKDAWMPLIGLVYGAIDNIIFVIVGATGNKFRVGMTSKALIACDRDVILIYFKGLRRVSTQAQTVYFDFKEELQLGFPLDLIPEDKLDDFFQVLRSSVDATKVYFSNDLTKR